MPRLLSPITATRTRSFGDRCERMAGEGKRLVIARLTPAADAARRNSRRSMSDGLAMSPTRKFSSFELEFRGFGCAVFSPNLKLQTRNSYLYFLILILRKYTSSP